MNSNFHSERYFLNCFSVEFSAASVSVWQSQWSEEVDMGELRKKLEKEWFILRRGENIIGLPLVSDPCVGFGDQKRQLSLDGYEGLDFMRARLDSVLPSILPSYQPQHVRPFRFVAKKEEFISYFATRVTLPDFVKSGFAVRPRFELEARTIELIESQLQVVVAMSVTMQWEISASLADLASNGVSLEGLYVVLRQPLVGERRFVGRIKSLNNGVVELDESMDARTSIEANAVQLEGSKASFKRCLVPILKQQYKDFEAFSDDWAARFTSGPSFKDVLHKFSEKRRTVSLAVDVAATLGSSIHVKNDENGSVFRKIPPVEYCFDAAKTKRKIIPWEGLESFGPYDSDTFEKRTPRILVVVPRSEQNKAEQVLGLFRDGVPGGKYSMGFARVFGLRQVKFDTCPISDQRLNENQYARAYSEAIESHLGGGAAYDAAFVVVPDSSRQMPDALNPYLHAKALLLSNGIPSQELRVATLYQGDIALQYVLRNIAVSLYAKMDGAPWTVSQSRTYNDEIVIGMGMAEVGGSRIEKRQRHIGITTVFLGDGNYLLSNVSRECTYDEYPEVLKASTKSILAEVKRRNGWEVGDRVRIVFHSSKPLKNVEIDELISECVADIAGEQIVEFASLQVSQEHPFKVVDYHQNGVKWGQSVKGKCVPDRGFVMQLGANTRLLATNGPAQIKRVLSPLPSPLLIHLHKRSTSKSLDALTEQMLKFTSMTWRSTSPSAMPVTIYYSELIAELLAKFKAVPGWSPALLNTKLRASKWFL